jgi:hypothetical protein
VGRTGVQWGDEVAEERVDGGKRGGGCHALGEGGGGSLHRQLASLIHRETLVVPIHASLFLRERKGFIALRSEILVVRYASTGIGVLSFSAQRVLYSLVAKV